MRLSEALAQMTERPDAHRFYPVVGENDRLVGMISRSDALRGQSKPELMDQSLYDAISDTSLPVAHADDTVGRVADIMIQADTGRVPVVEPQTGRLVGLIARKDLLRLRSAANRAELERGAYLLAKG
jgi:predicted transcriptional regulator